MPDTVRDLAREALTVLGVQSPGETFEDDDADVALTCYNRLLDAWNAEYGAVYADQWLPYTFTPNLNPHTWGASGATWTVANRPLKILDANQWLGSTPDIRRPIRIRDAAWWNNERVPDLAMSYPTDLYPNYTWPNAELNFWPVPDTASAVELHARIVLAQVTLNTSFSLPAGYWRAHVLSLAEEAALEFGVPLPDRLEERAGAARALVWGNNKPIPRIATRDAGMPRAGRGRGGKMSNFYSREI